MCLPGMPCLGSSCPWSEIPPHTSPWCAPDCPGLGSRPCPSCLTWLETSLWGHRLAASDQNATWRWHPRAVMGDALVYVGWQEARPFEPMCPVMAGHFPSLLTNLCDLCGGGEGAVLPVMLMEESLKKGN